MMEKKVLETRKKAYNEISARIRAGKVSFTELCIMSAQNHGLGKKFVKDYVDLLAENNEIKIEGGIVTLK